MTNLDAYLHFRTTRKIKRVLEDYADDNKMTVSQLCRDVVESFGESLIADEAKHKEITKLREQTTKLEQEIKQKITRRIYENHSETQAFEDARPALVREAEEMRSRV